MFLIYNTVLPERHFQDMNSGFTPYFNRLAQCPIIQVFTVSQRS